MMKHIGPLTPEAAADKLQAGLRVLKSNPLIDPLSVEYTSKLFHLCSDRIAPSPGFISSCPA